MARPKSEFLSSLGIMFQIWKALVDEVLVQGGRDDNLRQIQTDAALRRELVKMLVGERGQEHLTRPTYSLNIDYSQTLGEMIAAGKYDWVNNDITAEYFPIVGTGQQEVEVKLFHFNHVMTSEQVITEMDKAGCHPAKIEELLALGVAHPEFQRQFPVVALGSPWRDRGGRHCIPCLNRDGSGRRLDLSWFVGDWSECCRFLAARK